MKLQYAWEIGNDRSIHAGFAVCKLGKLNKPMEMVSGIFESAEKAFESASRLGAGFAAFRIVRTRKSNHPYEKISESDLPIHIEL